MSIYTDLANAIVAACNTEGSDVDAVTFHRFTATCEDWQRTIVERELPTWAQRRILETTPSTAKDAA